MDEQAVGEALHQRGWRKAFTVSEMVDKWSWLVAKIEKGYSDLVDEYTNDLYCRNWLHEAWVLLPDYVLETWTPQLKQLDDRFRGATVFDDGQALSHFHHIQQFDADDMWWWRRYPQLLTGDLGQTLRSTGATGWPPQ